MFVNRNNKETINFQNLTFTSNQELSSNKASLREMNSGLSIDLKRDSKRVFYLPHMRWKIEHFLLYPNC